HNGGQRCARARMISVVACDPELPPLEMTSGTNRASTTALAISASKNPIAVAVSISLRNRITSQVARLWTSVSNGVAMYGISTAPARLDGAHAQHVLPLFIDHHVDDVIKADDASVFLQHRDCKQVVFANLVGDRLLAVVRARGNRLGP